MKWDNPPGVYCTALACVWDNYIFGLKIPKSKISAPLMAIGNATFHNQSQSGLRHYFKA